MPSAQGNGDWGGGLLDNLRGVGTAQEQCDPTDWQAVLDSSGNGVAAVSTHKSSVQDRWLLMLSTRLRVSG